MNVKIKTKRKICRAVGILALVLMLAMIVICILLAMPARAAECRIASAAPGEVLPPDPERVRGLPRA